MQINILAIGQSNLANHCGTLQKSSVGSAINHGKRYPLHDPIPGGSGTLGSVWPRFAEYLKSRIDNLNLHLTLTAQGGTSIEEWAPGGRCFNNLQSRIEAGDTRSVNLVIFQQGEKDTLLETGETAYLECFRTLHHAITKDIGALPWIICRSTYRFGATSSGVRSAQNTLATEIPYAHSGPDLDTLGTEFRRDDTHFNDAGLDIFAREMGDCVFSIYNKVI